MKYFYSNIRIHIHVSRILSAVRNIFRPKVVRRSIFILQLLLWQEM